MFPRFTARPRALARALGSSLGLFITSAAALQAWAAEGPYPFAGETIGTARQVYEGGLLPSVAINTYRNIDRLFPSRTIKASDQPTRLPMADTSLTDVTFSYQDKAYNLNSFLKLDSITALLVIKDGRIVHESYQYGNTAQTRWMSMSMAKSVTSTLAGIAIKEGLIKSVDAQVTDYVPSLKGSAYDGVTIRDVLRMSSGVKWNENYTAPDSNRRALLDAQIAQKPGAALAMMGQLPRVAPPGTVFNYNTGEAQVLSEVVRAAVKKPLSDYLSEKVWQPYGMEADATWWLDSANGTEIGGSGISATLRDYGRFGLFFMNEGRVNGTSVLPAGWVHDATAARTLANGKKVGYGYMWWAGSSDTAVQHGAYAAMGVQGQNIFIDPAEKVVIVTFGAQPRPLNQDAINPMAFFDAVVSTLATPTGVPGEVLAQSRPAEARNYPQAAQVGTTSVR